MDEQEIIIEDEEGNVIDQAMEIVEDRLLDSDHYANLAESVDEDSLKDLASDLSESIRKDIASRSEWEEQLRRGLPLLGLKDDQSEEVFEGSCVATDNTLIQSIVSFQAQAIAELMPMRGPAKTQIVGQQTPEVLAAAQRIKKFMNAQIIHGIPEYYGETERMAFQMAYAGTAVKKMFYDPAMRRPVNECIRAEDFIVPYGSPQALAKCDRYTHRYWLSEHKINQYMSNGFFLDVELMDQEDQLSEDSVQEEIDLQQGISPEDDRTDKRVYECHTILDGPDFSDEDGVGLPYIVHLVDGQILSIRKNWRDDDPKKEKRIYFVPYHLVPGFGWYGYGYVHLIGSLAFTATASLRQMVDSASFANMPVGIKAQGTRTTGDDSPFTFGEFREINVPSGNVKDAIHIIQFPGPSQVTHQLFNDIKNSAKEFAQGTQAVLKDNAAYGNTGTILSLMDAAAGKMMSSVHKRMHFAQMHEFKILAELNYEWLPNADYTYKFQDTTDIINREDFRSGISIIPVSDPNMPTQAHRLAQANALLQTALQTPKILDIRKIVGDVLRNMNVEEPESYFLPPPQQARPLDPVSENMEVIQGKPIVAGIEQNHMAHIKAHNSWMQSPMVAKNLEAKVAIMAHIQEHIALDYRVRIQNALGMQLPPPGQPVDPRMEERIAVVAAEVTEQIVRDDIMQELMKDPNFVIAQEGFAVEREKLAQKEIDDQREFMNKQEALDLKADQEALNRAHEKELERMKLSAKANN